MNIALWTDLFATAEKIHAVEPWKDLAEEMIFAIQPRADGPVYFTSVMGLAGVHRAVAFYRGAEGLFGFRKANEDSAIPRLAIESLLLCEQYQLSFEAKKNVFPGDMEVLKACGKRYRGKWPVFHSHRPARVPWTVTEVEALEFKILAERSLAVMERIARGENLARHFGEEEFFLVDSDGHDSVCRIDDLPAPRHILQFGLPQDALQSLRRVDLEVELEMALLITPIQHGVEGEPPFLPFLVVMMDAISGMVMGHDTLDSREGVDSAMIRLPETITAMLKKAGVVPRAIRARHPSLLPLLHAYCQAYGIELIEVEEFEHADLLIEQMKRTML